MNTIVTTGKLPRMIGITGHAGAGKNTVAEMLQDIIVNSEEGEFYHLLGFADPLKKGCSHLFGIPLDDFYDKDKKEIVHPVYNVTPRQILQYVGTEIFREHFGRDFWIKRTLVELTNAFANEESVRVIFPDVRFQEEVEWIASEQGIIIHLTRPEADGKVGILNHASEAGVDLSNVPYILIENDGTLEELREKVKVAVKTLEGFEKVRR